ENVIASAVENAGIVAGEGEWRVPVEAIGRRAIEPGGANGEALAGANIATLNGAVLRLGIDDIRIVPINPADKPIAAADRDPVLVHRPRAIERNRRPAPRAVVLQSAGDVIRLLRTDGHVIKLPDGDGVELIPVGGAIVGGVKAAIAAHQHVARIALVDPHRVLIGVNAFAGIGTESFAALGGFVEV